MISCVYKIVNPSGRVYVGQTINFDSRILNYKKNECKKQPRLYHSIMKHGFDSHVVEILMRCEEKYLNDAEIFFIKLFDSQGQYGLNVLSGGIGGRQNAEARIKMSNAKKGKKQSAETIKKRTKGNKGSKRSEKTKMLMRAAKIGKRLSKEHREKLSRIKKEKGYKPPSRKGMEGKRGALHQNYGEIAINAISVIDLSTGIVYPSIKKCSSTLKISRFNLQRMLSGATDNTTKIIKYERHNINREGSQAAPQDQSRSNTAY